MILVDDDGVGIDKTRSKRPKKSSKGLYITKERLRLSGQDILVRIIDRSDFGEQETRVEITLRLD